MAKQKLTIETKGFPTSISGLLGISNQFVNIPLDVIDEIDDQPFPINEEKIEQIADSIENVGVIEPIIVVEKLGRYKILSGRHRYRACKKLGKEERPARRAIFAGTARHAHHTTSWIITSTALFGTPSKA